MATKIRQQLRVLSSVPSDKTAFAQWLELKDAITFLRENASTDEIVVYASTGHDFLHAILVPASAVATGNADDFLSWDGNPYSSWGVVTHFRQSPSIAISSPLDFNGSKALQSGEQLLYARSFEGDIERTTNFEVLQRLAHVCGLHFVPE